MNIANSTENPCIRVQARPFGAFTYVLNNEYEGTILRLLKEFHKYSKICYTFEERIGIPYGNFNATTKTFNGNLGLLQKGEYDLFLTPVFSSSTRYAYFDHTDVINVMPMSANYAYPTLEHDFLGFIRPFDFKVWITIVMMLCLSFSVMAISYMLPKLLPGGERDTDENTSKEDLVPESFLDALRIFLAQAVNFEGVLKHRKGKLFMGIFILASLILNLTYKCNLKAALIIPRINVPFNNFEEMVAQKELGWVMADGTVFMNLAKSSHPGTIMRTLHDGAEKFSRHVIKDIKNIAEGKYAFISNTQGCMGFVRAGLEMFGKCSITLMKGDLWSRPVFTVLSKNNRFYPAWNNMIRRFTEAGIINYWYRTLMRDSLRCEESTGKVDLSKNRPLILEDFYGIFGVLLAGLSLSFAVFIGELLIAMIMKKRENDQQKV